MSLDEDVKAFRIWATSIGCPQNAIPSEDALKSIFKSRSRELFCNLMARVKPRQEVKEIRENILVSKMNRSDCQVISACARALLPREMQTHLKIEDAKKKKGELQSQLKDYMQDFDMLFASIKTKNIQCMNLEHKNEKLQARVNILKLKSESLSKEIATEEENKERIIAAMPVKLTPMNSDENRAKQAIEQALKELEIYYDVCNSNDNLNILQEARDELWKKMRDIFANIPNALTFNTIMRMKDEQLENIMALNKSSSEEVFQRNFANVALEEPLSPFQLKLLKAKADLLGLKAKYLVAHHKRAQLEDRFANKYGSFVDELQKKLNLVDIQSEESEEIISEYLVQYNLRNFSLGQNELLAEQIETLKAENENSAKKLENHEMLLQSINEIYNITNTSVNRLQTEILQLGQIKKKILFSTNISKQKLSELQSSEHLSTLKSNFLVKINDITVGSGDSFEMAGDNVFCSTKLDLDSTTASCNSSTILLRTMDTTMNKTLSATVTGFTEEQIALPPHLTELNTFVDIDLDKLSCVPKECACYFSPNPLVVESRELSSTIQLAPGILLTPFGALEEVRKRIMWAESIAAQSRDLKLNLDLVVVDGNNYRHKMKELNEQSVELLDKIEVTGINTLHALRKLEKLYDFIRENPLRYYIPPTKTYCNRTYADYETVFQLYYKLAGGDLSSN